jgi:tetratricopeptide (TPR) repeat protein
MNKYILVLVLILINIFCFSQKILKSQGLQFFKNRNYSEAIKSFKAFDKKQEDGEILKYLGKCYMLLNEQQNAIEYFNKSIEVNAEDYENLYLIGVCEFELGKYEKSSEILKYYLSNGELEKSENIKDAVHRIKTSGNAIKMKFNPQIAYVENLGSIVNSEFDETKLIQSKNIQSRFYFTSARNVSLSKNDKTYNKDVFVFDNANSNIALLNIMSKYNTVEDEQIEDFNGQGSNMLITRSSGGKEFLYQDTFNLDVESIMNKMEIEYNSSLGDKDIKFYNENTYVFASKRFKGFGGYDIFIVSRNSDGKWQNPENLGKNINSKFDEVGPYITKGGNTIFLSSNRDQGLGGFDVYASQYNYTRSEWDQLINLGAPINSTKDDLDVSLSNEGSQLLISSNRIGGKGGSDLYIGYLKEVINDQLVYTELLPMMMSDSIKLQDVNKHSEVIFETNKPKEKQKSFVNIIMYFSNDDDVLSIQNKVNLKNIYSLVEIFPELKISIIGHSGIDQDKSIALFFTIKRMESIANELMKMGISSDKLSVNSYGNSFPGTYSPTRYNSRIEMVLQGVDEKLLSVYNDKLSINEDLLHLAYPKFIKSIDKILFKVKVATVTQMMRNSEVLSLPQLSIFKDGDQYEYYTNYSDSFQSINIVMQELQSKGYTNAEIIPFIGHRKIGAEELEKLSKSNGELLKFINR